MSAGALPLMVGLLNLNKSIVYAKCLKGMLLYMSENEVEELDQSYKELSLAYLKKLDM
jgi:hypothetical protein